MKTGDNCFFPMCKGKIQLCERPTHTGINLFECDTCHWFEYDGLEIK